MPTIEFLIEKKKVKVGQFSNLRKAALKNGIDVYVGIDRILHCPGLGCCGTCTMEIVEGMENLTPKNWLEKLRLRMKGAPPNVRLSCQTRVLGNVCVITNYKSKPSRQ